MPTFETRVKQNNDTGYDLRSDYYTLIVPSFLECYGINLMENDIPIDQFLILLGGMRKGVLIDYIRIRTENDPSKIAKFTEDEMKIYEEWQQKLLEDYDRINKRKRNTT